jgi:hypothetical protein
VTTFGRSATDSRPGSRRSAEKIPGRRQGSLVNPLRSFANGRYRVVQSSRLNSLREIEISKCERCGTELKMIDSIEDAEVIERSLVAWCT